MEQLSERVASVNPSQLHEERLSDAQVTSADSLQERVFAQEVSFWKRVTLQQPEILEWKVINASGRKRLWSLAHNSRLGTQFRCSQLHH